MNVLAIQPWYPSNAARFFVDAFERLGHEVYRAGSTYFDHYNLQYPVEELPIVDCEMDRGDNWNLDFFIDLATAKGFTPDLIWLSEENYQNTIWPTTKVPVVLWSADGWPSCYARRDMIQPTIAYTNHPLGVNPQPQPTIPEGWKFLPGAADSVWDVPLANNWCSESDFCLMATMYGPREKICEDLLRQGLAVNYGQATLKEWQMFYSKALSTYHNSNGQAEIKWRFFSAAALGCINICDDNYLLDAMGFKPWHYIPIGAFTKFFDNDLWPSVGGIVDAIRYLKGRSELTHDISQSAKLEVETFHRYENRIRIVLSDLGLGEKEENDIDCDNRLRTYMATNPYTHKNLPSTSMTRG